MYMNGKDKSGENVNDTPNHAWYTAEGEIQAALDADWKNYREDLENNWVNLLKWAQLTDLDAWTKQSSDCVRKYNC